MQPLRSLLLVLSSVGQLLVVAEASSLARRSLRSGRGTRTGDGGFVFTYENHGEDWLAGQCGSRERQSPIDFGPSAPWLRPPASTFYYDYASLEGRLGLQNNGHSLSVVGLANEGYGGIVYNNEKFLITALNFHMQSEHTFHGAAYPLEVHLVHKSEEGGAGLVIAVPFSIFQEPPRTYHYVGAGKCGTTGTRARAGRWASKDRTRCADRCSEEQDCHYFSLHEGTVCIRYKGSHCEPGGQANFTTYEKAPPTTHPYPLVGDGRCADVQPYKTEPKNLEACQRACSKERACKLFSQAEEENKCWLFKHALDECRLQPSGTFRTFEKRPVGENLGLMSLLGPEEQLPRRGSSSSHELPAPMDVLPTFISGGTFFEYEGSLTAPPCTEAVTWLVRREPQTMSKSQHDRLFASIMEATSDIGNWRAAMPLMGRPISVVAGAQGLPPAPPAAAPAPAPAPGMPVEVGLAAGGLAWDALGWAQQARALANQVAGAVQAHPQLGETPPSSSAAPGPAVAGLAPPWPAPWPAPAPAPAPAPQPTGLSALSLRRPPVLAGGGFREGGPALTSSDTFSAKLAEMERAMQDEADRSMRFGGEALAAEALR